MSTDPLRLLGVSRNPFAINPGASPRSDGRLAVERDPFLRPGTSWFEQFIPVEGFGEYQSRIDRWASEIDGSEGSNCFLVHGKPGTGLSTVANYIIARFGAACGKCVRVVQYDVTDFHEWEPTIRLFEKLVVLADTLELMKDTRKDVYDTLQYYSERQKVDSPLPVKMSMALRRLFPMLESEQIVPVVLLERVKVPQQLSFCAEAFGPARLIVFTSHAGLDDLSPVYKDLRRPGLQIELSKLTLDQIVEYVRRLWHVASELDECPFPEDAIREAFRKGPWEFKYVNTIFRTSLDTHASKLAEDPSGLPDKPPPVDRYLLRNAAHIVVDLDRRGT